MRPKMKGGETWQNEANQVSDAHRHETKGNQIGKETMVKEVI